MTMKIYYNMNAIMIANCITIDMGGNCVYIVTEDFVNAK